MTCSVEQCHDTTVMLTDKYAAIEVFDLVCRQIPRVAQNRLYGPPEGIYAGPSAAGSTPAS